MHKRYMLAALPFLFNVLIHAADNNEEFFNAIMRGNTIRVTELFNADPNLINAKDKNSGYAPLLVATIWHERDIAEFLLLQDGVDLECKSGDGDTPLIIASSHGRIDLAQLLLQYGADVNAKNKNGSSPLDYAWSHKELPKLLQSYKDNPLSDPKGAIEKEEY